MALPGGETGVKPPDPELVPEPVPDLELEPFDDPLPVLPDVPGETLDPVEPCPGAAWPGTVCEPRVAGSAVVAAWAWARCVPTPTVASPPAASTAVVQRRARPRTERFMARHPSG